ncbi:MAG: polysaccharide biosynthesis C-terminal domain-containing protein [Cyanobacteria bacterium P01_C01_bin.69]
MKAKRLLSNSLSLMINRVAQSIGSFLLISAIARILGPYELGQYTLAFSFYFLFMILASEGLKILFTRNLSRTPEDAPKYLISGSCLQIIFSCLAYAALFILVTVLPYSHETTVVLYLLGLMVIPFALSNVTEAIFQAQEKMYLIAISTVPIYAVRLVLAIWGMQQGYGIHFVCLVMVASEVIILFVQWFLISRHVKPEWVLRWGFIKQTALEVRTFFAIQGMSVFNLRMPTLMLSLVGGEVLVGLHSAVLQLMQPFIIIKDSLGLALFPGMTKAAKAGSDQQREVAEFSIEVLLCTAIPVALGLQFFGAQLLSLIYEDPQFAAASNILTIYGWSLVGMAIVNPMSFVLVANGMERINLKEQVVTTTLTALLGSLLIVRYELIGAAMTAFIRLITAFGIYNRVIQKRLHSIRFWRILRRPILISALMLVLFKLLQNTTQNIWTILSVSTVCYAIVAAAILFSTAGGAERMLSAFQKRT